MKMKELHLAYLVAFLFTCEGVEFPEKEAKYCRAPPLESYPTLQPSRNFPWRTFYETYFQVSHELQDTLSKLAIDNEDIIRLEAEDESKRCEFHRQCNVERRVVNYWQLPDTERNHKCWLIQPIIWTVCDGIQPSFNCGCPDLSVLGFACVQQYQKQAVWVYCNDGTITVRNVLVASGCNAMSYFCDHALVPYCGW